MKNKFIAFSLAIIGICTVACRQSDENFDEDFKASKESPKDTPEKGSVIKKDSVINNTSIGIIGGNEGGDPPRNGTHWRTK